MFCFQPCTVTDCVGVFPLWIVAAMHSVSLAAGPQMLPVHMAEEL